MGKKRLEEISGSEITVQMAINTFSNISIKFLQTKNLKIRILKLKYLLFD